MTGNGGVAIRGLQAEVLAGGQVKWQVLVIQPVKNPEEFKGKLEVNFAGTRNGKPWTASPAEAVLALQFRQYRRIEGALVLPPEVVLKAVSVKIWDGAALRATQTLKL